MPWILIKKDVPCEVKPQPLGVYFGTIEKVFFKNEYLEDPIRGEYEVSEFVHLYRKRKYDRTNPIFIDLNHAYNSLQLYKNGEGDKLDPRQFDKFEQLRKDHFKFPEFEFRMKILTENGEMCVEPHEYSIIDETFHEYCEEIGNGYEVFELGGKEDNQTFKDQFFYMQSRGISKSDALPMLFGSIKSRDVFYLKPRPELQEYFGFETVKKAA